MSYVQVNTYEIDRRISQVSFDIISGGIYAVVPEPATWGMTLTGFGVIGAALRRKRRHFNPASR